MKVFYIELCEIFMITFFTGYRSTSFSIQHFPALWNSQIKHKVNKAIILNFLARFYKLNGFGLSVNTFTYNLVSPVSFLKRKKTLMRDGRSITYWKNDFPYFFSCLTQGIFDYLQQMKAVMKRGTSFNKYFDKYAKMFWLVFSRSRTESTILSLCRNIRVRENPYVLRFEMSEYDYLGNF